MTDTLIITNTDTEWPMGSLPSGTTKGRTRTSYWRSIEGDPNSDKLRGEVAGCMFVRVSTNERLSVDLILWLLSRVRGEPFIDPDGKEICIWLDKRKKTAAIAIGSSLWSHDRENPIDIEDLRKWITTSLEKNSKNFKGETK